MRNFKDYINEETVLTGSLVHPSMLDGFVKLFYTLVSEKSNGFKKQVHPEKYNSCGCGELYDTNSTEKIIKKRPFYKLTNQVITHYGKIFYILELDIDSLNAVTMFKEYRDMSRAEVFKYLVNFKRNILNTLKEAGFSVKSDRSHIYASVQDYIKSPSGNKGLIMMNDYQLGILKEVKKLMTYSMVVPAYNRYAITLKNVKVLKGIPDKDTEEKIVNAGETFEKVVASTTGKIEFFKFLSDSSPYKTVLNGFKQVVIQKEEDKEKE